MIENLKDAKILTRASNVHKCKVCDQHIQVYYVCDMYQDVKDEWCPKCFEATTACGRDEHGEGCATLVYTSEGE